MATGFHIFDPEEPGFLGIVDAAKGAGIVVDTPRMVGFAVLDISKLIMYRHFYDGVLRVWPTAQLLMMDTDSFYTKIESPRLLDDIACVNSGAYGDFRIDMSKIDKECPNKDRLGILKLEYEDAVEFAGVRAKCYSVLKVDGGSDRKFKGVKKCVVERDVLHEQYRAVVLDPATGLSNGEPVHVQQHRIISREHHLMQVKEYKKSLAPCNDKVFVHDPPYRSRPLGHWRNSLQVVP